MRYNLARRLTPQFSGGELTNVPWHFIHHRPLQLLISRLAQRVSCDLHCVAFCQYCL
jgi:hypothetical protein